MKSMLLIRWLPRHGDKVVLSTQPHEMKCGARTGCGETWVHSLEKKNKHHHLKFVVFFLFQTALYTCKYFCMSELLFLSEQAYAAALFPSRTVFVPCGVMVSPLLTKGERQREEKYNLHYSSFSRPPWGWHPTVLSSGQGTRLVWPLGCCLGHTKGASGNGQRWEIPGVRKGKVTE